MVPGTVTTHEIPLTRALHIRKRSKCRVVGETEELMEEGNIVPSVISSVVCVSPRPIVVQGQPI